MEIQFFIKLWTCWGLKSHILVKIETLNKFRHTLSKSCYAVAQLVSTLKALVVATQTIDTNKMLLGRLKWTESGILHSVFTQIVLDFNQTCCCVLSQAFILPSWVIKTQVLGGIEGVKYYPAVFFFVKKPSISDPGLNTSTTPNSASFRSAFRCYQGIARKRCSIPIRGRCFFFPGKFDGKPAKLHLYENP